MWLVSLIENLDPNKNFGTIQTLAWFTGRHCAEDYVLRNVKNMHVNPMFKYIIIERYKVNYPTKLIETQFPHFITYHEVFRWDDEKNTFIRDKRLDCKIPNDYMIAYRRTYPDGRVEFKAEELKK